MVLYLSVGDETRQFVFVLNLNRLGFTNTLLLNSDCAFLNIGGNIWYFVQFRKYGKKLKSQIESSKGSISMGNIIFLLTTIMIFII